MDVDLHIHSNVSDGSLPPSAVVSAAADARLDAIALADHDTVHGVAEAVRVAQEYRIEVVPAIEISATADEVELHILGYFVDPTNTELLGHVEEAGVRRETRLRNMVTRLAEDGVEVSFDAVSSASPGRGTLGRPHLARALVDGGYVDTPAEAFDRYIGNAHPAYIPTRLLDPTEAIRLIQKADGVAVWAHPPMRYLEELLPGLCASGLRGIEVYRPRSSRNRVLLLEQIARERGLLVSGGSDWHGPEHGPLGEFRIQASEVSALLAEGGM